MAARRRRRPAQQEKPNESRLHSAFIFAEIARRFQICLDHEAAEQRAAPKDNNWYVQQPLDALPRALLQVSSAVSAADHDGLVTKQQ